MEITGYAARRICKQEVTGSIPVGSTGGKRWKSTRFDRETGLSSYSILMESTAGEYQIGPGFAGEEFEQIVASLDAMLIRPDRKD